jgi:acyl dehydratase
MTVQAMMAMSLQEYATQVGREVGTSRWFEVDQSRIDTFANVTEDWQFIHVDPVAAAKSPFGKTVAHGFLTLSMLAPMAYDALPKITDVMMDVNYGFDKVRFIAPVHSGSRIRARFVLKEVTPRGEKEIIMRTGVVVEIEGVVKPALIADWLGFSYLSGRTEASAP